MAKENRDTKKKRDSSAYQKFEQLARKIVRVPKDQARGKRSWRVRQSRG